MQIWVLGTSWGRSEANSPNKIIQRGQGEREECGSKAENEALGTLEALAGEEKSAGGTQKEAAERVEKIQENPGSKEGRVATEWSR